MAIEPAAGSGPSLGPGTRVKDFFLALGGPVIVSVQITRLSGRIFVLSLGWSLLVAAVLFLADLTAMPLEVSYPVIVFGTGIAVVGLYFLSPLAAFMALCLALASIALGHRGRATMVAILASAGLLALYIVAATLVFGGTGFPLTLFLQPDPVLPYNGA